MLRPEDGIIVPARWRTLGHPGFFGKDRDEQFRQWDNEPGVGKWRIAWKFAGRDHSFDDVFWGVFVAGYTQYFLRNPAEAGHIVNNFAYTYDKTPIDRPTAFDPNALRNKAGIENQFHHVALNIALSDFLGLEFRGPSPLQVRDGKQNVPKDQWPAGWRWGPGHIRAPHPELIPEVTLSNRWWTQGTIEDLYQSAKVLQVAEN